MAGSVATVAVLWLLLQSMGYLGHSYTIGSNKTPRPIQIYLPEYEGISPPNYRQVIDTGDIRHMKLPVVSELTKNKSVEFAVADLIRLESLELNIAASGLTIESNSPDQRQYASLFPNKEALTKLWDAIVAIKSSAYLSHTQCQRFGKSSEKCAQFISTLNLDKTPLGQNCVQDQMIECIPRSKYRSYDGSCNNLEHPKWGNALTAYTRLLFPHYSDGIQEPKRVRTGGIYLPIPRVVTTTLSNGNGETDASKTLAVVTWGQFVEHDLAQTPVRNMIHTGFPIACCRSDGNTLAPRHIHPFCLPIAIPDKDPVYGPHRIRCLNYVRSLPIIRSDCNFGPAEQMNQVSQFLDGSTIYGSTVNKARQLRSFEGGRLRTEKKDNLEYMPSIDSDLENLCGPEKCYESGDDRANLEPHLAVMHTIWHREHNRIANKLAEINPLWSDTRLYQEARRIVVAEIQHITYNEWLPVVIGKRYARAADLLTRSTGYSDNYSPYEDSAVSNEVATAALRFLSSLKQSKLSLFDDINNTNKSIKLSDYFYKPKIIESNEVFDELLRGLVKQNSQKFDLNIIPDMTQQLYKTVGDLGLDIMSFDVQRGRDHGLPGYNQYRQFCGLPLAKTFEDFLDYIPAEVVKQLKSLYPAPQDVDLLIGGLAERSDRDGLVGPTFRCLIAEQFVRTKRTDRFFYDSSVQPYPFTTEQLNEIRNVTLARVFCDNANNVSFMPKNVFIKSKTENEPMCQDFEAIPSIDLFAWAEKAKAYR